MTDKNTERRLLDEQKMATEMRRVRALLDAAVKDCAAQDGDIRFLNAAFMTAAFQLHGEVEGTASLEKAVKTKASRELMRRRTGGQC